MFVISGAVCHFKSHSDLITQQPEELQHLGKKSRTKNVFF